MIACTALAVLVLGLVLWQFSDRGHELGAKIAVEQEMLERASAKLDPNSASVAELMALPGIGPSLAERIVTYRREYQKEKPAGALAFSKWQDLQNVRGIGPKISAKLRPYLEFEKQEDKSR